MSKMKELMLLYTLAAAAGEGIGTGRSQFDPEAEIKPSDRQLHECSGFGDNSKMRKFVINGKEILATDLKMAKKKYKKQLA